MTAATIRPPMPLPLLDEMSCYANCAAQALWMLGASDLPGAAAVRAVDRFTGREPGGQSDVQSELLYLLCCGLSVEAYGKPQPDLARLRAGDACYARQWLGRHWDPRKWTREHMAWFADECDRYRARWERETAGHGSRARDHRTPFTIKLLDEALAAGKIAICLLWQGEGEPAFAGVVFSKVNDVYGMYCPGAQEEPAQVVPSRALAAQLTADAAVIGR